MRDWDKDNRATVVALSYACKHTACHSAVKGLSCGNLTLAASPPSASPLHPSFLSL